MTTTPSRDRDRGVLLFVHTHARRALARGMVPAEIAERLGRTESEVAESLQRLDDEGLLTFGEGKDDLRVVNGLTEVGERAVGGPDQP